MMKYFCTKCGNYSCEHQEKIREDAREATKENKQEFKHEEE